MSVEAPQPLVLTGRTNPFPHQMFDLGLDGYVDDTWPGGLAGLGRDIDRAGTDRDRPRHHPPTVADGGPGRGLLGVGTTPGFTWYVHRSVPPDIQSQMRAIVNGS